MIDQENPPSTSVVLVIKYSGKRVYPLTLIAYFLFWATPGQGQQARGEAKRGRNLQHMPYFLYELWYLPAGDHHLLPSPTHSGGVV